NADDLACTILAWHSLVERDSLADWTSVSPREPRARPTHSPAVPFSHRFIRDRHRWRVTIIPLIQEAPLPKRYAEDIEISLRYQRVVCPVPIVRMCFNRKSSSRL